MGLFRREAENSSLYFEPANQIWFLFTNHIGIDIRGEYTDGIWVYWSKDLNRWDPQCKAVVLDYRNCSWSKDCIGMPTVTAVGRRLALLYDGPGDVAYQGGKDATERGLMGNAQTHCLQLPNTFAFARGGSSWTWSCNCA